jgi:hypothetical protein
MNKFLKVLGLGLMMLTFAFAGFAQTERTREVVYQEYMDNYQSDEVAKLQIALNAAKEYIAKFNTPDDQPQVEYFKEAIPTLEDAIQKKGLEAERQKEEEAWYGLLGKFEAAIKGKNWAEAFNIGKQAIGTQHKYLDADTVKGEKLDLTIILGVAGFDLAFEKNDQFNNEALNYLRSAIQQIEGGLSTKSFGLLGYELKDKENALGLLNYYMGYIMYYRQNKKEDALPYMFKATQYKSASKDFPAIYQVIGQKFYDKLAELDEVRVKKIEELKNEPTEEGKIKLAEEIKALVAEEKGVAERGMEAYAKAIKAADADPKVSKQYKDSLRSSFEDLYKFRFDNKTDGVPAYINTTANRPLTNPQTPVQPIVEEEKTDDAATDDAATSTTPSTKPATTAKKPR